MKRKALISNLLFTVVILFFACSNNTETKPVLTGINLRIEKQKDIFNYKLDQRGLPREISSEFDIPETREEMIERFGKPDNNDSDSLIYKEKGISVNIERTFVDLYEISAPYEKKTTKGIGIGSLADDVVTAYYGHIDPVYSKIENGKGMICIGHYRSIFSMIFDIDKNKVVKIHKSCRFD